MTILDRIKDLFKFLHIGKLNRTAQKVRMFTEVDRSDRSSYPTGPHLSPPDHNAIKPAPPEPNEPARFAPSLELPQPDSYPDIQGQRALNGSEVEIDFGRQGDLESYARGLTVSAGVIEQWLSAGILCPRETRVAEKLLKILREREQTRRSRAAST